MSKAHDIGDQEPAHQQEVGGQARPNQGKGGGKESHKVRRPSDGHMTDEDIARRWQVRETPSPEVIARVARNIAALRRL